MIVRGVWLLAAVLSIGSPVFAQSAENVAVIINDNDPVSRQVGEYYTRARGIPAANVIHLKTSTEDTIAYAAFVATIQQPIAAALSRARLEDQILYLVLTKGIPLRIAGTTGQDGTMASVDSELTLLYRRLVGQSVFTRGRIDNPYFLGTPDIREARPFTHRDYDIYLVSRLDAFTVEDALRLIDRGKSPETDGKIVLDQRDALVNRTGEDWLTLAASRLIAAGHGDRVILETSPKPARGIKPVLGYYSWGSTDAQNRVRNVELDFAPGALAATFVATDARSFHEPPANWVPTNDPTNRATWFAGSAQSLVGDLIRAGVTGAAGHVAEPYLESAVKPEILFLAYLSGFNLVESFYLAIPHLSWQTVVIGDPLCGPFQRKLLTRADIDAGIDPATELPIFLARRRVARSMSTLRNVPERAASLLIRAEGRLVRGDRTGARQAFQESAEAAPRWVEPQLRLATLSDAEGQYDAAIDSYRKILEIQPNNAIALNNLAYALAVRRKMPAEGLPLAKRAATLAPNDPSILDTLGWIQHLLGNHPEAAKTFGDAVRRAPNSSELRLHAAVVYAAAGARAVAEGELKEALRLNPELEKSDEVRELRARLADMVK
jgi:uncharacterized protein (TIGR03790 family)